MKLTEYLEKLQKIANEYPDIEVGKDNGMGGISTYVTVKVEDIHHYRSGEKMTTFTKNFLEKIEADKVSKMVLL